MPTIFRKRLLDGDKLFGTLITIPSPGVAEMLSGIGFDWLFIDAEHTPLGMGDIQHILQAAQHRCPCVVRLPANEERYIKQILDIGATGIIAPLVNTPEEAELIVRAAKYPPLGTRSVGVGRAHGYGTTFDSYVRSANENVAVIVQVEHVTAAKNVHKILDVEGIDAVFIGPYDLSASLGKTGEIQDPEVQGLISQVRDACLAAKKPLGILALDGASARSFSKQGYSLIAIATDYMMLARAAGEIVAAAKGDDD